LDKIIEQVQRLAELIGPNRFLQALAIAVAFILFGKVADWIVSRAIGRIARRSKTDFDDRLVGLIHRPIFLSFVVLGLGLATKRIGLPGSPEFFTLGVLKTIAVVIWYNMLRQLADVLVQTARRNRGSKLVQSGMLSLIQNVIKVLPHGMDCIGRYCRSGAQLRRKGHLVKPVRRRVDHHGCALQKRRLHHPRNG
jgi:hypothetical protein